MKNRQTISAVLLKTGANFIKGFCIGLGSLILIPALPILIPIAIGSLLTARRRKDSTSPPALPQWKPSHRYKHGDRVMVSKNGGALQEYVYDGRRGYFFAVSAIASIEKAKV